MLAHDGAQHPDRIAWLHRQTAKLLARTIQRGGVSRSDIARAFIQHGHDLLGTLALRLLEIARRLPAPFRSDPSLGRAPAVKPLPQRRRAVRA
jgi:hypothetical protein